MDFRNETQGLRHLLLTIFSIITMLPGVRMTQYLNVTHFEGHCYKLVKQRVSQSQAAQNCQNSHLQLVSIGSMEENTNVFALISGTEGAVWLGLKRSSNTSPLVWPDGTSLEINDTWAGGHPVNDLHCTSMPSSAGGKWQSSDCTEVQYYVCEGNASISKPATTAAPFSTKSSTPSVAAASKVTNSTPIATSTTTSSTVSPTKSSTTALTISSTENVEVSTSLSSTLSVSTVGLFTANESTKALATPQLGITSTLSKPDVDISTTKHYTDQPETTEDTFNSESTQALRTPQQGITSTSSKPDVDISTTEHFTDRPETTKVTSDSGDNVILYGLLGAACGLILIILVIVVIACKTTCRRQQKAAPDTFPKEHTPSLLNTNDSDWMVYQYPTNPSSFTTSRDPGYEDRTPGDDGNQDMSTGGEDHDKQNGLIDEPSEGNTGEEVELDALFAKPMKKAPPTDHEGEEVQLDALYAKPMKKAPPTVHVAEITLEDNAIYSP